ncbi:MAG TPA: hypothetical protein VFV70_03585 [Hyphomonadaceae bacterium]|nr:hypothetical protein [Hyphomonadaceae bacterium]
MQTLTAMTLGALALGAAAFAYDSSIGQTPNRCPAHQASVYFEKDATGLNLFAEAVIDRIAQEARACGAHQVVAQTSLSQAHADAISRAFASKGLGVIVARTPQATVQPADFVGDRAAVVRLTLNSDVG